MSNDDFERDYGASYETALVEAQEYVANPDKLRAEVQLQAERRDRTHLAPPFPDPFSYHLTLSQGFVRFPERLRNYLVAKNEQRTARRSFYPVLIDVEPVSRCNFRCVMCTVSEWKNGKRAEDMDLEAFALFLNEHTTHLVEMKLQGLGEPLLHKQYFEMVRLAVGQSLWVRTTVNGSLLHVHNNYQRLVDSGIGEVQTSFDGATKEVFEGIRKNSNFDRVVSNLRLLNDYADRMERPCTRMWVVVQNDNRHQLFEFVKLAQQMGFRRLTFSVSLVNWGKEDWGESNQALQAQHLTVEEEQRLSEIAIKEGIDISIWGTSKYSTESAATLCPAVFGRASITSDLRMVPCGMLGDPTVVDLGDARSFPEVWNSHTYMEFRQAHLDGRIPEHCRGCYEPC